MIGSGVGVGSAVGGGVGGAVGSGVAVGAGVIVGGAGVAVGAVVGWLEGAAVGRVVGRAVMGGRVVGCVVGGAIGVTVGPVKGCVGDDASAGPGLGVRATNERPGSTVVPTTPGLEGKSGSPSSSGPPGRRDAVDLPARQALAEHEDGRPEEGDERGRGVTPDLPPTGGERRRPEHDECKGLHEPPIPTCRPGGMLAPLPKVAGVAALP